MQTDDDFVERCVAAQLERGSEYAPQVYAAALLLVKECAKFDQERKPLGTISRAEFDRAFLLWECSADIENDSWVNDLAEQAMRMPLDPNRMGMLQHRYIDIVSWWFRIPIAYLSIRRVEPSSSHLASVTASSLSSTLSCAGSVRLPLPVVRIDDVEWR